MVPFGGVSSMISLREKIARTFEEAVMREVNRRLPLHAKVIEDEAKRKMAEADSMINTPQSPVGKRS